MYYIYIINISPDFMKVGFRWHLQVILFQFLQEDLNMLWKMDNYKQTLTFSHPTVYVF